MKRCLAVWAVLAFLLCMSPARAEEAALELVLCQYHWGGGMVNSFLTLTLEKGETEDQLILEKRWEGKDTTQTHAVSPRALQELENYIMALHPEKWQDLPEEEFFALDAPSESILVMDAAGGIYALSDSKIVPDSFGDPWKTVRSFLESYAAGTPAAELAFPSLDGDGQAPGESISPDGG